MNRLPSSILFSLSLLLPLLLTAAVEFKEPDNVASTEGLPNNLVKGCVCAISGEFVQTITELAIPGPEPLVQTINYGSRSNWSWSMSNHETIVGFDANFEGRLTHFSGLRQPSGSYLFYYSTEKGDKELKKRDVLKMKLLTPKGLTQGGRLDSGKTNLRSQKLIFRNKTNKVTLQYPSGDSTLFEHGYDSNDNPIYRIKEISKINGSKLQHVAKGKKQFSLVCKNSKTNKTYSHVDMEVTEKNGEFHRGYKTSDNRRIDHFFMHKSYKIPSAISIPRAGVMVGKEKITEYYLKKIASPSFPEISFEYEEKAIGNQLQISRKILPKKRHLEIDYYKKGNNNLGGSAGTIKITDKFDYRLDRVKRLRAPVGNTEQLITTHTFVYHEEREKNKKGVEKLKSGKTTVYDAYDHQTKYEYDPFCRLTSLIRYTGTTSYKPYAKELFLWGKEGNLESFLFGKFLTDKQQRLHTGLFFNYDEKGNVIQTVLCGALTGNSSSPVFVDENLQLVGSCETENKYYTYTDQYNLLKSETDSNGVTVTYDYVPGTDWISSKLTSWDGRIRQREFQSHDENGVVTLKVVDDGTESQCNDLNWVNERKITRITPRTKPPIGLPQRIEELYANPPTWEEVLLGAIEFEYDLQGHPTEKRVYDANNHYLYKLTWNYDEHGNILSETNALGQTIERTYDENDNLTEEKRPSQKFTIKNKYDYVNRLTEQEEVHKDGQVFLTKYEYNYTGQCTKQTDLFGNETLYEYDDLGRLTRTNHPKFLNENGVLVTPATSQELDIAGYVIKSTDPKGRITKTERNIRGQPTKIIYPDNSVETFTYRIDGKLISKIEKNGSKTVYALDPTGRIIGENYYSPQEELLKATIHEYDSFHLIKTIDPEDLVTTYSYDRAGRLEWTRRGNRAKQCLYDSQGRLFEEREWFGENPGDYCSTITHYDLLDRVVETRMEDSSKNLLHVARYAYDEDGNCILEQVGEQIIRTAYNAFGEPIVITNALEEVIRIDYDRHYINGLSQQVLKKTTTDPLGTHTIEIYDAADRLVESSCYNPYGQMISRQECVLDLSGNLVHIYDFQMEGPEVKKTIQTVRTFSLMNQETSLTETWGTPEQKITRTEYNPYGQKSILIKPDGTSLFYNYDTCGRLLYLSSSDGSVFYQYSYNKNDQVTQAIDLISGKATERVYDSLGQLIHEKLANGFEMTYGYDRMGRHRQTTLPDQSTIERRFNACYLKELHRGNKAILINEAHTLSGRAKKAYLSQIDTTIDFDYDALGRCVSIRSPSLTQTIPTGGYDKAGNLRQFTLQNSAHSFDYDDLYQLTAESGHSSHHYRFDSLANRNAKNFKEENHNDLHQLLQTEEESFSYDLNGNMTSRIKAAEETLYTHDALDRLTSVICKGKTITYQYDAFNRRVAKITPDKEELFLYQGQNEIGLVEKGVIRQLKIISGEKSGAVVAFELDGKIYFPLTDLFGNMNTVLNDQGKPVESYRYTAFGEEEIISPEGNLLQASVIDNPSRYAGKRADPDTGLISFGLRDYDASLGRWVTPDPAGFGDGPNLYAYVHNRPLILFDAYGLSSEQINEGSNSLWNRGWNQVGGAIKNIYYSPRFQGGMQAFGGLVEAGIGGGMTYTTGGFAGPLGWPVMAHGLDHCVTGMSTVWSGIPRDTATSQLLQQAGMSPETARFVDNSISIAGTMGGGSALFKSQKATYSMSTKNMGQITKNEISLLGNEKGVKRAKNGGRNRFFPDANTKGAHSVFRKDPVTGKISKYETYKPQSNPLNPNPWESVKRFDGHQINETHFNKILQEEIHTPHVHDPLTPGGIRPAELWEMPR